MFVSYFGNSVPTATLETKLPMFTTGKHLRACEWALIVFFLYVACISRFFHLRSPNHAIPFIVAAIVIVCLNVLAWTEQYGPRRFVSFARDWLTLALVFVAYRLMDWFTLRQQDHHLENYWIVWDQFVLHTMGLQKWIEATGPVLPTLLELSYLLVYAVGPFTVAMLYLVRRRHRVGWVLFVYVVGTVAAYGLFPYFPSSPPRAVFPNQDVPHVTSAVRNLNLFLVGGYGIHSSVFPSAHVSSAFSAAWGVLLFVRDRKRLGWGLLVYAVLVSVATVYGRYHYAVDALAGLGISVAAAGLAWLIYGKKAQMAVMHQE